MLGGKWVQGCSNCSNSPRATGESITEHSYIKLCKDIIALYVIEQSKLHFITPSAGLLPADWTHGMSVPACVCPQHELSAQFQKRL